MWRVGTGRLLMSLTWKVREKRGLLLGTKWVALPGSSGWFAIVPPLLLGVDVFYGTAALCPTYITTILSTLLENMSVRPCSFDTLFCPTHPNDQNNSRTVSPSFPFT